LDIEKGSEAKDEDRRKRGEKGRAEKKGTKKVKRKALS
jgi:hypothetical protein